MNLPSKIVKEILAEMSNIDGPGELSAELSNGWTLMTEAWYDECFDGDPEMSDDEKVLLARSRSMDVVRGWGGGLVTYGFDGRYGQHGVTWAVFR